MCFLFASIQIVALDNLHKCKQKGKIDIEKKVVRTLARARFIHHPSNKAKFIRWVVYTANAALMVG